MNMNKSRRQLKNKSSIKEYITNLNEFDEELKDLAISIIYATIRPNKFWMGMLLIKKNQQRKCG